MTKWAVGVTCHVSRALTLLPRTLRSLQSAGWEDLPRLFIDGTRDNPLCSQGWHNDSTCRWPIIGAYGNFILGIAELYIRNPQCTRFAMFQDDVVMVKGLRRYLERYDPPHTYLNLYTHPMYHNFDVSANAIPKWRLGCYLQSPPNQQQGIGALALVFNRDAVLRLLTQQSTIKKPMHPHKGKVNVDGAIVTAMNGCGYLEHVHSFSLVQHEDGDVSTLKKGVAGRRAICFPGENFDATNLIPALQS